MHLVDINLPAVTSQLKNKTNYFTNIYKNHYINDTISTIIFFFKEIEVLFSPI